MINKIKIGGMFYKVELEDCHEMGDDLATTDFNKCLIKIDESIEDCQKECAFLHEILHCINNQLSEKEVEFLAQSLYQILKDNYKINLIK